MPGEIGPPAHRTLRPPLGHDWQERMDGEASPELEWIALYREEGPTMAHLFAVGSELSLCGHVNRAGRPSWSKSRTRCARCEKAHPLTRRLNPA